MLWIKYKKDFYKLFTALGLVAAGFLLLRLCAEYSELSDRVFVPIAGALFVPLKLINGLFPFSIYEIALILLLPAAVFIAVRTAIKNKHVRAREFYARFFMRLSLFIAAVFFIYLLLFGLPARRSPMLETMYGGGQPADTQQLYGLTVYLIEQANETRTEEPLDFKETSKLLKEAYSKAAEKYDYITTFPSRPKPVIFSKAMSYLGISGIFMPFTGEANVSVDSPGFNIPYTMAHEMAHSVLIMNEAEANFTAFLVSLEAEDELVRYSAYFSSMIYALNSLSSADKELYAKAWEHMSDGVYQDILANNEHARQYEGPVSQVSETINDAHIKLSGQSDGVKSYGRVTDLMLAWYMAKQ